MSKIDDYKKYWAEVVLPDYHDFCANKGDIRKAFHASTSLNHMADWLYHSDPSYFGKLTFKDKNGNEQPVNSGATLANHVRKHFPDFEIIRGVANASKHLSVSQAKHADAPTHAANTYVSEGSFDAGSFDGSSFDIGGRVMQEGRNKQDFSLDEKVDAQVEFWKSFCARHNKPLK